MKRRPLAPLRRRGAALLTAMLTVTLVATFSAAALWQQWRAVEIEAAERARVQAGWVLIGALDWSRLILREDARASGGAGADHLAEPWAVPLAEARLSAFLSAEKNVASDQLEGMPDAFLSGRIVDAQSKLNVLSLVENGKPVKASVDTFIKLFELLGLPGQEVSTLAANLARALPVATAPPNPANPNEPTPAASTPANGPLMPQHTAQLVWLGVSPTTAAALEPYVTVLPVKTALNLNTASAEAIYASVPKLDLAGAKRLVAQRSRGHFRSVADAAALVQESGSQFTEGQHSVGSSYFEVLGRLRLDTIWIEEHSLLRRDGIDVRIVWRERGAGATLAAGKTPG